MPQAPKTKHLTHTVEIVHGTMLVQICRTYRQLPDIKTMPLSDIRFWYDGIRKELHELGKRKSK